MRKLVYECKKDNAVVRTVSFAQAEDLRVGGWNVTETLETIPEKTPMTAKQAASRIKI